MLTPPSCSAILTGFGSETGWKVPAFQSNLENIAAYCSGISVALEHQNKTDINVVALAGDGGTVDIGLQALSGAVERGHKFIYVCYDNEAYMNTGIQRSGSTPVGAWTTTTPGGRKSRRRISWRCFGQGIPMLPPHPSVISMTSRKRWRKQGDRRTLTSTFPRALQDGEPNLGIRSRLPSWL